MAGAGLAGLRKAWPCGSSFAVRFRASDLTFIAPARTAATCSSFRRDIVPASVSSSAMSSLCAAVIEGGEAAADVALARRGPGETRPQVQRVAELSLPIQAAIPWPCWSALRAPMTLANCSGHGSSKLRTSDPQPPSASPDWPRRPQSHPHRPPADVRLGENVPFVRRRERKCGPRRNRFGLDADGTQIRQSRSRVRRKRSVHRGVSCGYPVRHPTGVPHDLGKLHDHGERDSDSGHRWRSKR
jgi:hypothetical protein